MIFNKIGISDPETGVLGAILTPAPIFLKIRQNDNQKISIYSTAEQCRNIAHRLFYFQARV